MDKVGCTVTLMSFGTPVTALVVNLNTTPKPFDDGATAATVAPSDADTDADAIVSPEVGSLDRCPDQSSR